MSIHILLFLQQGPASRVGHVHGVPPGGGVILPPPVFDHQRPSLIAHVLRVRLALGHTNVAVCTVLGCNVLPLFRIVLPEPGNRMPAHLHHGPALLEVVCRGIPQESLQWPPEQRYLAPAVIHVLIPGNLGDRRPGAVEVLTAPVVHLLKIVSAVYNVMHHILEIVSGFLGLLRLRHQLGLRHGQHLVGHHVIDRTLQRLHLECLFPGFPGHFRIVLLRIRHMQNLSGLLRRVMVRPVHLLEDVQPVIDFLQQLLVLRGQRLLLQILLCQRLLLFLGHRLSPPLLLLIPLRGA